MSYFNFRAQDNFTNVPFRYRGGMMPPAVPQGGNVSVTNNVSIKNGPQGFWGFMSSLAGGGCYGGGSIWSGMGGLGNMGMLGGMGSLWSCIPSGCFGGGLTNPLSGMFGVLNGASAQGTGSSTATTPEAEATKLQGMFPNHGLKIVYNNGKFYATDDDTTKPIDQATSFDDMYQILADRYKNSPSTTPSSTPSTTPSSTPSATPSSTPSTTPSSTPSTTPSSTPSATPSSGYPKKVSVPKGDTFTKFISDQLKAQGVPINQKNIDQAKIDFKAQNPHSVHKWKASYGSQAKPGYEYLIMNEEVTVPQFKDMGS